MIWVQLFCVILYTAYDFNIEMQRKSAEAMFTKTEMNNEGNINFLQNQEKRNCLWLRINTSITD